MAMGEARPVSRPLQSFWDARTPRAELHETVTLTGRRIFILPTPLGISFALVVLLMLAGAINYNNSLVFALTFLLTGLGLVSMLHCYRNLAGLQLAVTASEPAFAGQAVHFQLRLQSPAQARLSIRLSSADHGTEVLRVDVSPITVWLPRGSRRRGRQTLGKLVVATRYPLGLFHCWSNVDSQATALVYPKPLGADRPLPDAARRPHQDGDQGRGNDDFQGFRHYHPGDSPRHLNWKALAREQPPLTKTFGGDRVEELWLDWDRLDGDTELRLSQLCRWVLAADRNRACYGLRLPGREISLDSGDIQRQRCLTALAEFT